MTRTLIRVSIADRFRGEYTRFSEATTTAWSNAGWCKAQAIMFLLTGKAQKCPERATLARRRNDSERAACSSKALDKNPNTAGGGLGIPGVAAGDSVVLMFRNWLEHPKRILSISELGPIYVGIPVADGERDGVLVIRHRWRSNDHLDMSARLHAKTTIFAAVTDNDSSYPRTGGSLIKDDCPTLFREVLAAYLIDKEPSKHYSSKHAVVPSDLSMSSSGRVKEFNPKRMVA